MIQFQLLWKWFKCLTQISPFIYDFMIELSLRCLSTSSRHIRAPEGSIVNQIAVYQLRRILSPEVFENIDVALTCPEIHSCPSQKVINRVWGLHGCREHHISPISICDDQLHTHSYRVHRGAVNRPSGL